MVFGSSYILCIVYTLYGCITITRYHICVTIHAYKAYTCSVIWNNCIGFLPLKIDLTIIFLRENNYVIWNNFVESVIWMHIFYRNSYLLVRAENWIYHNEIIRSVVKAVMHGQKKFLLMYSETNISFVRHWFDGVFQFFFQYAYILSYLLT